MTSLNLFHTRATSIAFIVNFEHTSHFFPVFILLLWTFICLFANVADIEHYNVPSNVLLQIYRLAYV